MPTTKAVLLTALIAAGLSACGQTGPLYLPQGPAPAAQPVPEPAQDEVGPSIDEAANPNN